MNLRIMLVLLMMSMFPAHGATGEPFGDDAASMRTAVGDAGYSGSGEDLAAFPQPPAPPRKSRSLRSHHHVIDMEALNGVRLAANTVRSTAASASSMESFSQVNPTQLFDRDTYLRDHIAEMISDENDTRRHQKCVDGVTFRG